MSNNNLAGRWPLWVATLGLLMIMAGVLLPIVHLGDSAFRWVYAAGALTSLAGRLFVKVPAQAPLRVKRLMRIETWSSIFFCAAAAFLFWPGAGNRDWIALTIAGGAILVYTSIMIPRAARKGDGQ